MSALIEECRFFLACQLMKEDKHEKAIEAFQQLKSPYASFYQVCKYRVTYGNLMSFEWFNTQ